MAEVQQKNTQVEIIKLLGPVLDALRQIGGSGKPKEVEYIIAKNENISQDKLKETLKNGGLRFSNQVAWARYYLVREGLIENNDRGLWVLSPVGHTTHLVENEARKIFFKWDELNKKNNKQKNKKPIQETNTILRDIDPEKDELSEDFFQAFNPKDIDITVETRSLDTIISRIKHEAIDLNTYFQRKGDLWTNVIMSRLIESILIRFPLPAFYFDAADDDKWLIVDGVQRLSAIRKFVLNTDSDYVKQTYTDDDIEHNRHIPLKLTGLEYLQDYNGKIYSDLPPNMQRRIREAQITTYLVRPGTPEDVVYSVFYRINTGGLMLNPQEIRHALNQKGNGPRFLEELAESEIFKKTVKISDKRMEDRELALRYIAFKLHSYEQYKSSMKTFLNKIMKEIDYLSDDKLLSLKESLFRTLDNCNTLFGDDVFSKSITKKGDKSNLNRPLFEVWTITLSNLNDAEINYLIANKHDLIEEYKTLLLNDSAFNDSISFHTTGAEQVKYRFHCIEKLVKKYIA